MEAKREELLEELFKEMFCAFRALRPDVHDHKQALKRRFVGKFGNKDEHEFGRGHMDLFFRLKREKDGVLVKDIAQSLNITSGAVTQMVDKAVKMGIVTREEDAKDRRSQRIKLSEKAKKRVEEYRMRFMEKVSPKFSSLTDREVSQLTLLLGKISMSEKES